MLRVLGIDPSLSSTGWAMARVAEGQPSPTLTESVEVAWMRGTIKTKPARTRDLTLLRFDEITGMLGAAIGAAQVTLAVIEGPAFSKNNGMAHERAGLWWSIYDYISRERGIRTLVIGPTLRTKYATGRGNAGKDEVMLATAKRYPDAGVTNNNEADAAVLAAMGARWLGRPFDVIPLANALAMKTLI